MPEVRVNWWSAKPEPGFWVSAGVLALACLGQGQRRTRPLLALVVGTAAVACGPLVAGATGLGVLLVFFDLLYCAVLYTSLRAGWAVSGARRPRSSGWPGSAWSTRAGGPLCSICSACR
ncbi:hypothetical protein [Pseudonocardia asaccharolytica]|uniref:Uncharacterized protein n=1 Tax=Pseudonocardia asaccharolytica DSM 44247 = NBRC 16224 TaxID=1123024 RepID=A0A511CWW6_9PSEU|nr:hypothetical protein [Pseudonocardia asaccharolytica]GEL17051.1 hypothetical protein PA7_08880 [Pseudonocardia asaccharolytica DSM 44247 = NBRC 16224]